MEDMGVYVKGDMKKLEALEEWMEEGKWTLMGRGGDFNARTRRLGGSLEERGEERNKEKRIRKSKDRKLE